MSIITNQSSLTYVAPEYLNLLNELQTRVKNHFGADFRTYYLLGSVGRGENLPGVSDMDTVIILKRAPNNEDELWEKAIQEEFEPKYPTLTLLNISCIKDKEFKRSN
jgi:Nucleotidyltransferase domain